MSATVTNAFSLPSDGEIARLNRLFEGRDPQDVLSWIWQRSDSDQIPLVSSFGADSVVLLAMAARVSADFPVVFIDTGKHFAETLHYVETVREHFGLTNLQAIGPDDGDLKSRDSFGALWISDPDACCDLRKTIPLDRFMQDRLGWITGRKRFQTQERSQLSIFEKDGDKLKINPLANWGPKDISAFVKANSLPGHPLIPKGFLSIGCAPCTSPVAEGEDARSGRWKGTDKTECGLHI